MRVKDSEIEGWKGEADKIIIEAMRKFFAIEKDAIKNRRDATLDDVLTTPRFELSRLEWKLESVGQSDYIKNRIAYYNQNRGELK